MQHKFLPLLLLALIPLAPRRAMCAAAPAPVNSVAAQALAQPPSRIHAVVELGPNYIFHILAVARISFDSDYADKYSGTLTVADREYLDSMRTQLTLGGPSKSKLYMALVIFPAYLNLDTQDKIHTYFSLLEDGIRSDDFSRFIKTYSAQFSSARNWIYTDTPEQYFAGMKTMLHSHLADIERMGGIYERDFPQYRAEVWPKESAALEKTADKINRYFAAHDVMTRWEQLTGMHFAAPQFQVVLSRAIKNGPDGDSLGYERDVFFARSDLRYLIHFISHEAGTHLLISVPKQLYAAKLADGKTIYGAYECMCRFYNSLIMRGKLQYDISDPAFDALMPVFRQLHEANTAISPAEMLSGALSLSSTAAQPTPAQPQTQSYRKSNSIAAPPPL